MSKIFILEDDKNRISKFQQDLIGHEVTIRSSYFSAYKEMFANPLRYPGYYDVVFLDFDLVDTDKPYQDRTFEEQHTGGDFALDLYDYYASEEKRITHQPLIIIHSMNHQAAGFMSRILRRLDVFTEDRVAIFPGAWESLDKFSKDFDPVQVRMSARERSVYKHYKAIN